jgi:nucleoporin NDC1
MEAIVRFRSNIISLESELLAQAGAIGRPGQTAAAQVKEVLSAHINGEPFKSEKITNLVVCDSGIRRISYGFGSSMSAFRFPPSIASALNEICKEES